MPTEVLPAVATPAAGETVHFTCTGAVDWRIEPQIPSGTQKASAGSFTYVAPAPIGFTGQFAVIALDGAVKELGRAVMHLEPTQVLPAAATVVGGETVQFKCAGAVSWRIVPEIPAGVQEAVAGSFTYAAPMPLMLGGEFAIIALDGHGKELSRAVMHLQPTQLKVHPAKVEELRARDSIQFSVEPVELAPQVKWSLSDSNISISEAGVLTAPENIATPRNLAVTATWKGSGTLYGFATVRLSDHNFKSRFAAGYSLSFAIILLSFLICLVASDCLDEKKSRLSIVPPAVTLRPDDTHQFQARLTCASNATENTILWQATAGTITNGFYRATVGKEPPATVTITAINKVDPCDIAVANVFLSATGRLEVIPPFLKLSEFQSYQFDVVTQPGGSNYLNYQWHISPEQGAGTLTVDGFYMSPSTPSSVRYARIIAQSKTDPRIQAAALVELSCTAGCGGSKALRQLFFILVLGALGATIHCMRSLGDYVGNQKFVPSWFLYYLFKPFIGAALAYVVVSHGALKGDSGTISIGWGALAALVGLFSDSAVTKLGEIAKTLFGNSVTREGRNDKLDDNTRPTVPPDGSPVLQHVDLSKDTPRTLIVTGAHFNADCKIKIGDDERGAIFEFPNTLKLVLKPEDLAQKVLKIAVINKTKQSSATMILPIT